MSSISIIKSGCPEATEEVSGEIVKRVIQAIAFAVCPITLVNYCQYPEICEGCRPVMEEMLMSVIQ